MVNEETGELSLATSENADVERQLHRTIAKVEGDIERLAFNTAIASLIAVVNAATGPGLSKSQAERFARVLSPFAPHMAEELWSRLGMPGTIALAAWPTYDPAQLKDANIEVPVQIAGKVRHRITVPSDLSAAELEAIALADDKVKELLVGKTVRKVVVIPNKLVNIVAN